MIRSPWPNVHYSACLASNIEQMFATRQAPYDVRCSFRLMTSSDSGQSSSGMYYSVHNASLVYFQLTVSDRFSSDVGML